MRPTRWLTLAAPLAATLSVLGAVVSVLARWPHQFGVHGDPRHMVTDFVSSGTALAPPLIILIVFAVAAGLVGRRDRWGTAACVVVLIVSLLMIIGALGEATANSTPAVPRAVQLLSGVWGTLVGTVLVALATASLQERRRARVPRSTRAA